MIRQAHTYLAGAFSGVTLIGIGIAIFAVLVSAQVFHAWPIVGLGGHDGNSAVAPAKTVSDSGAAGATTNPASSAPIGKANATATPAEHAAHRHGANDATAVTDATAPAAASETTASVGGEEASSGGNSGSHSSPGSSSGSSSGGSSGSSASPGSGATGSSGSGSGGGTTATHPTTSEAVSGGVNETVNNVDEALGGTLEKTGVTGVTEGVVNGVVGPESVVGKTVDGVGEVVSGVVGTKGQ